MYKKLLIAIVCILTTKILVDASATTGQSAYNFNFGQQSKAQAPRVNQATQTESYLGMQSQNSFVRQPSRATDPINTVEDLETMQQIYAEQPNNTSKALYISAVLDNDSQNITIQQKIEQAENLLKIVNSQISLLSGWLWNDPIHEPQIAWLENQRTSIGQRIARLQSQATYFGMPTLWGTVKWTSAWLGTALLVYLALNKVNDYYNQTDPTHPDQYKYDYVDIAALPARKFYQLAKWSAVNGTAVITGEKAQEAVKIIGSGTQAVAQGAVSVVSAAASATKEELIKDANLVGKYLVDATKPTPELTLEQKYAMAALALKAEGEKRERVLAAEKEKYEYAMKQKNALRQTMQKKIEDIKNNPDNYSKKQIAAINQEVTALQQQQAELDQYLAKSLPGQQQQQQQQQVGVKHLGQTSQANLIGKYGQAQTGWRSFFGLEKSPAEIQLEQNKIKSEQESIKAAEQAQTELNKQEAQAREEYYKKLTEQEQIKATLKQSEIQAQKAIEELQRINKQKQRYEQNVPKSTKINAQQNEDEQQKQKAQEHLRSAQRAEQERQDQAQKKYMKDVITELNSLENPSLSWPFNNRSMIPKAKADILKAEHEIDQKLRESKGISLEQARAIRDTLDQMNQQKTAITLQKQSIETQKMMESLYNSPDGQKYLRVTK